MSGNPWTKGPWRAFPFAGTNWGVCNDDPLARAGLAIVRSGVNAQLIALAPDMATLLEDLADRLACYAEWCEREIIASRSTPTYREIRTDATSNLLEVRALLAKARGGA